MEIKVPQHEAEKLMLQSPDTTKLRHWSKLYSAEPHLAGDLAHAERIRDLWISYGIPAALEEYQVLQNFPKSQALHLLAPDGQIGFEASLTEDEVSEDPTSSPRNGLPAFHGFSANGEICAELVYANFGELKDFELLKSHGISVKGKIVICKYAKVFRGLKVRAAEQYGAAAVILYNDPQEDGEYTVENGYEPYPHGPARHPKIIQRGSVDYFSVAVGDPTTPGYPSLPDTDLERQDPGHATPRIPSLPISYADAIPFLQALNGHGLIPSQIAGEHSDWKGCLPAVDYCTGPSQARVFLSNQGEQF
ncbi:glutamate carboxypeptidase II [Colletotrichum lupini]|uniref:Glutamate carboxypeptidase II n=1 Tax=Colletotrichum lupini TaxID=145971 RepID=A0A9Q8SWA6_9PEZI|nr:glutamate carboxypeptidase II [Colletotrichum lupini]UQC83951.1 glutamate carboxypeptidase II [Colletotrichum lupini]